MDNVCCPFEGCPTDGDNGGGDPGTGNGNGHNGNGNGNGHNGNGNGGPGPGNGHVGNGGPGPGGGTTDGEPGPGPTPGHVDWEPIPEYRKGSGTGGGHTGGGGNPGPPKPTSPGPTVILALPRHPRRPTLVVSAPPGPCGGPPSPSVGMGNLTALARSTQAVPPANGVLFVGAGCGISTVCSGAFAPPQSVLAGVRDFRLGM